MLATTDPTTPTPDTFENDIPLALARAAHAGTSFVPEKRGDQERASYAAQLRLDLNELAKLATTDDKRVTLAAEFARYRSGYRQRYIARLSAMSRTLSTMIAGPSNFNTRRNSKRGATADKRTLDVCEYREDALAAIRKALCPELRPIMAGDANATERLEDKIAKLEERQAGMRAVNATIRKHAKAGADAQIAALVAMGYSEGRAKDLLKPDFLGRVGFADYALTNNSAQIRRLKERLTSVSAAKSTPTAEIKGDAATIEDNAAENRIRIYFPGKPDVSVRDRLKGAGFRWARSLGCWQAYRSDRATELARDVAGVVDEPPAPEPPASQPDDDEDSAGDDGDDYFDPLRPQVGDDESDTSDSAEPVVVPTGGHSSDDQVWRSLAVYRERGEFDGYDIDQARECLIRAGYEWPDTGDRVPADIEERVNAYVEAHAVRCPKCQTSVLDDEDNFAIRETYRAYHPFNAKAGTAENALGTTSPSEHFDDGAGDYEVLCQHCTHEGSFASFKADLKDWT